MNKLRRDARFDVIDNVTELVNAAFEQLVEHKIIANDQLRLIFTCCHPALAPDVQVALTLREIGGLTTEQIAAAFLIPMPTLAQRIVRAKSNIHEARIPCEVPAPAELPARPDRQGPRRL